MNRPPGMQAFGVRVHQWTLTGASMIATAERCLIFVDGVPSGLIVYHDVTDHGMRAIPVLIIHRTGAINKGIHKMRCLRRRRLVLVVHGDVIYICVVEVAAFALQGECLLLVWPAIQHRVIALP